MILILAFFSKLLQSDIELMPPCLDALTNLSVQSDIRRGVRQNLIDTLKTSTIEYLPNIVKFLLYTCDSNSFDDVCDLTNRQFQFHSCILVGNLRHQLMFVGDRWT